MNINSLEMGKKLGLITSDNKPNYEGSDVIELHGLASGWKKIFRPYIDPVHGVCTASVWVKDDKYFNNMCLEKDKLVPCYITTLGKKNERK